MFNNKCNKHASPYKKKQNNYDKIHESKRQILSGVWMLEHHYHWVEGWDPLQIMEYGC